MTDLTPPALADRLAAGGVQIAQAIGQPSAHDTAGPAWVVVIRERHPDVAVGPFLTVAGAGVALESSPIVDGLCEVDALDAFVETDESKLPAQRIVPDPSADAPAPEVPSPASDSDVSEVAGRAAPEALAGLVQTVAELDRGLAILGAEATHYVRAPRQRAAMLDTVANLRLVLATQDTYLQLVLAAEGRPS